MPSIAISLLLRSGRSLLDVLLPPRCLSCDAPVEVPGQMCVDCFGQTDFITEPSCGRCGVPFPSAGTFAADLLCPTCNEAPPAFRRARAALRYNAQGRRLILPFKHADRPEIAAALAPHMVRAGAALLREADVLVPVPLHRRRLFHRRYNQAALLTLALSRLTGVPASLDSLIRCHATAPLGDKSAAERGAAVQGAFAMRIGREARIATRHVVLVDDVMTSGSTANACARVLLAAGAASVDVLVAARVPDPRLG